jgi:hypothetical protein
MKSPRDPGPSSPVSTSSGLFSLQPSSSTWSPASPSSSLARETVDATSAQASGQSFPAQSPQTHPPVRSYLFIISAASFLLWYRCVRLPHVILPFSIHFTIQSDLQRLHESKSAPICSHQPTDSPSKTQEQALYYCKHTPHAPSASALTRSRLLLLLWRIPSTIQYLHVSAFHHQRSRALAHLRRSRIIGVPRYFTSL